ncbi:hypothetical protein J2W21_003618 [Sinomonas atrocyanea]|nr:hypothetical protein [Sinomonas atrocyanea]
MPAIAVVLVGGLAIVAIVAGAAKPAATSEEPVPTATRTPPQTAQAGTPTMTPSPLRTDPHAPRVYTQKGDGFTVLFHEEPAVEHRSYVSRVGPDGTETVSVMRHDYSIAASPTESVTVDTMPCTPLSSTAPWTVQNYFDAGVKKMFDEVAQDTPVIESQRTGELQGAPALWADFTYTDRHGSKVSAHTVIAARGANLYLLTWIGHEGDDARPFLDSFHLIQTTAAAPAACRGGTVGS